MSYVIHHINCATLCPMSARLINGHGSYFGKAKWICHCLLIETNAGLVLVDTGLGTNDIQHPKQLGWMFNQMVRPVLSPEETALAQILKSGFKKEDVQHIILTHLHADHAGGISDFPMAKIHVMKKEYDMVVGQKTVPLGYATKQFKFAPRWRVHNVTGEKWNGFDCVSAFEPALQDILLVPLHGHSTGHAGIFIPSTTGDLFHCGDAYFDHHTISSSYQDVPFGIKIFQKFADYNTASRILNQIRLTQLFTDKKAEMQFICSHDINEFEYCACGKNPNHIV